MTGGTRERALVGAFVLVAGAVLFAATLMLTGGIGTSRVAHRSYFRFSGGLEAGAAVRYAGLTVGKVTGVHVDPRDSTRIEVEYAVDSSAPLRTDSLARVTSLGLLSDNYLEVAPGTPTAPIAPAGSVIPSKESFGFDDLANAVEGMLPDVQKTLKTLNTDLNGLQTTIAAANDLLGEKNRASIAGVLGNLDGALKELRPVLNTTLGNLDKMLADAQPKIAGTLTGVEGLVKKLDPTVEDLDKTVKTADQTLAHVDQTLTDNRKNIDASVASLKDLLQKSNSLVGQLNSTLDQNADNLDESLENVRLLTENLRQLTETLKRSPASIIRGINVRDRRPGGLK